MKMTIGANIKRLRAAKEITQEQLSVAMNVTCAAVSKWERGETYPDITLLQPLAYYFGVTLDELMGYDQEKIAADIDEVLAAYVAHIHDEEGHTIITKVFFICEQNCLDLIRVCKCYCLFGFHVSKLGSYYSASADYCAKA